jgi:predicted DNA-binding protein (MmcQ/YjbR family)
MFGKWAIKYLPLQIGTTIDYPASHSKLPAPYLASRGLKWIQRYALPGLSNDDLQHAIAESHRIVASGFSQRKRSELGL